LTAATVTKGEAAQNGAAPEDPQLPVDTLREAITHLRRPFTPEAVKFKIQTNPKSDQGKAMVVTFIDARLVSERLNAVCPHLWSTEFEQITGGMLCKLTIDGQTRADAGHAENTSTDIGLKSLYSDAFKRAAVHFGVGASLYTLPRVYVPASALKKIDRQGKTPLWFLPQSAEASLRGGYATWLDGAGKRLFGPPLDHGDQEHAQGDHEVDVPAPSESADRPPATGANDPQGITRARASTIVDRAMAAGIQSAQLGMQLVVLGVDLPEGIATKGKAIAAVRSLAPEKADELERWVSDCADKLAQGAE
jgi:hypothetical protein